MILAAAVCGTLALLLLIQRPFAAVCWLFALSGFVSFGAVDLGFNFVPPYLPMLAASIGAVYLLATRNLSLRLAAADYLLLAFVGTYLLVTVLTYGQAPDVFVPGAVGRNSRQLRPLTQGLALVAMTLCYFLPRLFVKEEAQASKLLRWYLGGAVVVLAYGYYQILAARFNLPLSFVNARRDQGLIPVLEGIRRTNSTLTEPTTYAHYLVILISLLVTRRLSRIGTRKDFYLLAGAILALGTTVSRSGIIAMAFALLLLPLAIRLNRRGDPRRRGSRHLRTYALIAVAVVGLSMTDASGVVSSRFNGILGGSESYVRVGYWKAAWSMSADHRGGVGIGNYAFYYFDHLPLDGHYEIANEVTDAHNVFLDFLAEGGVLALVLFVAFLGAVAATVSRGSRRLTGTLRYQLVGVSIGLLSAFAMQLTFSFFYLPYVWLLLGLVVTISNLQPTEQPGRSQAVAVHDS